MDTGDWVALVSAVAAVASAVFAGYVWKEAKRVGRCQLLVQLMRDYAEPKMQKDVSALWSFEEQCRKDNKDISDEFRRMLDSDDQKINTARRPVTHFYQRMAVLRKYKVVEDKILYHLWAKSDLRIIPEIIEPLEKALLQWHGKVPTNQINLLHKLYEDSNEYWRTVADNTVDG